MNKIDAFGSPIIFQASHIASQRPESALFSGSYKNKFIFQLDTFLWELLRKTHVFYFIVMTELLQNITGKRSH